MSDPKAVLAQLLSPPKAESLAAAAASSWQVGASTLHTLLGSLPGIEAVDGRLVMPDEIVADFAEPHLVLPFEVSTATDQSATAYGVLPADLAALFFQSLADDPADQEQQTIVVAATMFGQVVQALNTEVFADSPGGVVITLDDITANAMPDILGGMDDPALALTASIEGERPLPFTLVLPGNFLDILANALPGAARAAAAAPPPLAEPAPGLSISAEEIEAAELREPEPVAAGVTGGPARTSAFEEPDAAPLREPTPISQAPAAARARFAPLPDPEPPISRSGIDLLASLRMNVTVELGRTELTVADVLGLGPGSVVELDRLAGEPVDILVNDRLVARGEVVVVDENFGVRVVEVVRRGQDAEERAS